MTLPRETLIELMALADGELEGEAKARAEELALHNDEARQVVEALRSRILHDWLADTMAQRTAMADGIADAVMREIREAAPGEAPLSLARKVSQRPAFRRGRGSAPWAVFGVALGVAAAVALYARFVSRGSVSAPVARQEVPASAAPVESAPSHRGVVVDEIDSPSRDVSIFQIPAMANAAAPSSVVVWIDDEQGAR